MSKEFSLPTQVNLKLNVVFFVFAFFLVSCESSRLKEQAENKTLEFFSSLKKQDEKSMSAIYPDFKNFDTYFKSDSAKINYSNYKDSTVIVSTHSRFTNGFGKLSERDILMYFKKDSSGALRLYDSKGLTDFEENKYYKFGIKTGCINKNTDTTDQTIMKSISTAEKLMVSKYYDVYLELLKKVYVVSWSWESGYAGSASGKGIVKNASRFSIPDLKYKIVYKDYSGNEITSDDGYISYNEFEQGESKSFTFYTSYVGGASKASIELKYDDKYIMNYLAEKDWSGNEYQEYLKSHPNVLSNLK